MEQELGISVSFAYVTSKTTKKNYISCKVIAWSGADPGIQVRGEGALKKIAPSGGRRENCWGISCEKSRFYAKKSFFPILGCAPPPPPPPPPPLGSAPDDEFLVRVARSLFSVYCFIHRCLYFSVGHCFVCPSNYDFWLPLRYLQNFSSLRFPDIYTWSVFSMVCLSTTNITIRVKLSTTYWIDWLIFGVLTPLSTIFQLYHGDQF